MLNKCCSLFYLTQLSQFHPGSGPHDCIWVYLGCPYTCFRTQLHIYPGCMCGTCSKATYDVAIDGQSVSCEQQTTPILAKMLGRVELQLPLQNSEEINSLNWLILRHSSCTSEGRLHESRTAPRKIVNVFFGCRRQLTTPSLQLITAEIHFLQKKEKKKEQR